MRSRTLKLSEICWDLFLNSLRDRACLDTRRDLLVQLPIPAQFIDRIH